jgi:tRNA(Arg) A34 adenosine deaminase TadA
VFGAIQGAGIGRVVFGFAEDELRAITGANPANPTRALPCRQFFTAGHRAVTVVGPLLSDDARRPHLTFWG